MSAARSLNRRRFIAGAGSLALAVGLAPSAARAAAEDRFEIALSQYSLRAMFRDGRLDPLDFADFTVDTFGIEAIDLWEGGLPKEKLDDAAYLGRLRARADKAGCDLFLLMSGVLDASPSKAEASLRTIGTSVDRASALGCRFLRVFLRVPGKDVDAGVKASVEALEPLADRAAAKKLVVAIEPGASMLSQRGAFLARVVTELRHPACKLMPDFGKLRNNVYEGTAAMLPHTVTISAKMHSFDDEGRQPDFDYDRLIRMIVASKYRGYLAIEWEGRRLEPVAGVKASKALIVSALSANGVTLGR